jgi:peptidoglycan/LPS O-acetylase OafA/YrhL
VPPAFASVGLHWSESVVLNFVFLTALTLTVSSVSWYLIERPINLLKNRGGGAQPRAVAAQA